jgi:hypothetical protein
VNESHDAVRIDEDISSELQGVRTSGSGPSAAQQFLRVHPPGSRAPDVTQPTSKHPIPAIQAPRVIDDDRPTNARFFGVGARRGAGLERHDYDSDVEVGEGRFVLLQLQQVPAARQSAQMAVKHQQQPVPPVVLETMDPAIGVRKREGDGRMADHVLR